MTSAFDDIRLIENVDEISYNADLHQAYLFMVYAEDGTLQVNYNDREFTLHGGDFLVCMPSVIVGNYMRTPDFKGKVVCVGKHLFDEVLSNCYYMEPQWWEKEQYVLHHPVVHMSESQRQLIEAYLELLRAYQKAERNAYRERILRLSGQAAACEILGLLERQLQLKKQKGTLAADGETKRVYGAADQLFQRFCDLVGQYGEREREVQWYADKLLVSPKYLSSVCKQKTGYTASGWIADATVSHIRHFLLQTDLSIKEISFRMNFPDVSFFCKYTRKYLNMSPLEFRRKGRK